MKLRIMGNEDLITAALRGVGPHPPVVGEEVEIQGGDTLLEDPPEAKAIHERLTGSGFLAFKVDEKAGNEQIKEFDPEAEEILYAPQIQGG